MQALPECAEFSIATLTLKHGSHGDHFTGEACAIEASNRAAMCIPELRERYGAPKRFTDDHPSISRVIRAFVISWNDSISDDETRTRLLSLFVTRVLGTATTAADEDTRAWMATDWLCRVQTPAWLRLAGLTKEAEALEATVRIVDAVTAGLAQPALDDARSKSAAAAGAAAGAAAWAAAGDAAGAAAWAAAGAAAWDAAGAAAWDAAGAAAWAAAGDAAWDAAGAAAWAAAGDAAGAAAGAAAWAAAGDAAGAAAGETLAPVVASLQESAVDLLGRMCDVSRTAEAVT